MLQPIAAPGLFITGTDTSVGKTLIAAAIAAALSATLRVGVCKPVATGCHERREGLVSEDAELLAHHARSPFPLDVICPQRFYHPLAPSVAARYEKSQLDWAAIERSLQVISRQSDFMLVEGIGGIMVPMDAHHSVVDMAAWLGLPAVIVARPNLGTINHTLLTVAALRQAGVKVAGIVINRYPVDTPGLAEETSPEEIARVGKAPILCLAPDEPFTPPALPAGVREAIARVDWIKLAGGK